MKISIKVKDKTVTATLIDNKTTQDFISLLPLTLALEDYARTEKISDLPERLSTEDAPSGSDPAIGDIAYYAPWGNLAIFYRDFGYANGLVILGKIDSGVEALMYLALWKDGTARRNRQCRRLAVFGCVLLRRRARPGRRWRSNGVVMFVAKRDTVAVNATNSGDHARRR